MTNRATSFNPTKLNTIEEEKKQESEAESPKSYTVIMRDQTRDSKLIDKMTISKKSIDK